MTYKQRSCSAESFNLDLFIYLFCVYGRTQGEKSLGGCARLSHDGRRSRPLGRDEQRGENGSEKGVHREMLDQRTS